MLLKAIRFQLNKTLSTEQNAALLEGKPVIALPKEMLEARNAAAAYDMLSTWRASDANDLLAAHKLLMSGLVDEAGQYCKGGVGVMSGDQVIHMAPQAGRIVNLMDELLFWLGNTNKPPLIASCIFHYEFEFIHPFSDGNGRMGRMWQKLILSNWHPIFSSIPVEGFIHRHQDDYNSAIRESTVVSDSNPFVEFMLRMISTGLDEARNDGVNVKERQIPALLR